MKLDLMNYKGSLLANSTKQKEQMTAGKVKLLAYNNIMKKFILLFLLILPLQVLALPIDEKLTLRVVDTSETRKTVLINRGFEDGLVKGDHAKFFLSVGVVARGVLIKGSPTRSVWSLYRLVNTDYIRKDQVLNLKITPPVKVTKDESKTLVEDDTPSIITGDPRDLGIPLAPGADDITEHERLLIKQRELTLMNKQFHVNIEDKHREIFSTFYFGQYSSTTTPNKNGSAVSGKESTTAVNIGYEHYFKDETKWFSRISLIAQLSFIKSAVMAHESTRTDETTNEYGVGANIYPFKRPKMTGDFIYYGNFSFMMGSTTTTVEPSNSQGESLTGSVVSYSFGGGVKYYTPEGYGARMQFDYIMRGDQFTADSYNTNWVKRRSGPRIVMGFSYRF